MVREHFHNFTLWNQVDETLKISRVTFCDSRFMWDKTQYKDVEKIMYNEHFTRLRFVLKSYSDFYILP